MSSKIVPRYLYAGVEYFHSFTMYLDLLMNVPLSSEINCHLFSFAHIHVKVRLESLHHYVKWSRAALWPLILRSPKAEKMWSTVIGKLNKVTVLLVTAAVVSVHNIEKGRKDTSLGDPVQVTARTEDNMLVTNTCWHPFVKKSTIHKTRTCWRLNFEIIFWAKM